MSINKNDINYLDFNTISNDYIKLSEIILKSLENEGYIVVKNFDVDVNNVEASSKEYLKISELIGNPIGHDADNKIIWDIKSNDKSVSVIKTYSEHSHEAELHTDSQYSSYPEDYFGLLTLKKATCGGGLSYLVSLKDILRELRSLPNGNKIEEILSTTDYPFIVPNVFKKSIEKEVEFNYGPILRDNEIRFRIDTFEKALIHKAANCTEQQVEAYRILKNIILNTTFVNEFYLEPRDLIFINNKTMLHGRSQFTDSNRHLLRIRMNKLNK
jgi:alpha-ketoglutarate-dependent taurine dioxygenase